MNDASSGWTPTPASDHDRPAPTDSPTTPPTDAVAHDEARPWVDADLDNIDADSYDIDVRDVDGDLRLVAAGPCPTCGFQTISVRDEVDFSSPIFSGTVTGAAVTARGAGLVTVAWDIIERIRNRKSKRPKPNRVQFTFVCKCPHPHAGNPDEKNPRGCGSRWSLVAQAKQ